MCMSQISNCLDSYSLHSAFMTVGNGMMTHKWQQKGFACKCNEIRLKLILVEVETHTQKKNKTREHQKQTGKPLNVIWIFHYENDITSMDQSTFSLCRCSLPFISSIFVYGDKRKTWQTNSFRSSMMKQEVPLMQLLQNRLKGFPVFLFYFHSYLQDVFFSCVSFLPIVYSHLSDKLRH